MHKGMEILFQRTVEELHLSIDFGVIGGAHAKLDAAKLEEFTPKFANKDKVAVRDQATG